MSKNNSGSKSNTPYYVGAAIGVGVLAAAGGFFYNEYLKYEEDQQKLKNRQRYSTRQPAFVREIEDEERPRRALEAPRTSQVVKKVEQCDETSSSTSSYRMAFDNMEDLEAYSSDDDYETADEDRPIETIIRNLDQKLNVSSTNFIGIIDEVKDLCYEIPEEPRLLWRLGQAYYKLAWKTSDTTQLLYINKGIDACKSALKYKRTTGEAYKWLCMLMGLRFPHLPNIQKIEDAFVFEQNVEKAVNLLPTDSIPCLMLGRFHYECANLGWLQRTAAAALYTEPPQGSFDRALTNLQKADRLSKTKCKLVKLFIAKTQIALGSYGAAAETLRAARMLRNIFMDTELDVHSEVETLYNEYRSYA